MNKTQVVKQGQNWEMRSRYTRSWLKVYVPEKDTWHTLRSFDSQYKFQRKAEEVTRVEVLETWRAGGLAEIEWADGEIGQEIFGKRKPGTVGKLKSFGGRGDKKQIGLRRSMG